MSADKLQDDFAAARRSPDAVAVTVGTGRPRGCEWWVHRDRCRRQGTYTFTFKAQNSQGTQSASAATVTLMFPRRQRSDGDVLDGSDKTTDRSPTIAGSSRKTGPSTSTRTARRIRRRPAARPGRRNRADPGRELPYQLHAVRGAGLHGAAVLRRRPDGVSAVPVGVRRRQRRLPDHGGRQKTAVMPEPGRSGSDQALLHLGPAGRRGQSVHRRRLRSATAAMRTPMAAAATAWAARRSTSSAVRRRSRC